MARIDLTQIAHSYLSRPADPSDYALRRLDHVWEDGGAYALLGPSGCGKTTLLNVISGLIQATEGRVQFDGRDVTDEPTERRNIAQVFQFPVIYDTMTVFDNLAFPLRNRGVEASRIKTRVHEVAEMLELTGDLKRRARGLAVDGKQKISLGRGLVRSDVAAILFDEPLTVIDPHLKWQLRRKLKEIHERFQLTFVYVTHDQNEALTFADQVVVMYEGQIVQVGTPQALFENPKHTFVGFFIGSPGMNLLPCELDGDAAVVDGARIPISGALAAAGRRRLSWLSKRVDETLRGWDPGGVGGSGMDKWPDNRAWFLVLPVFVIVALSAIIPLMTVVNYSVQDIFGPGQRIFVGAEWFEEVLGDRRLHDALWRQFLFSGLVLLIEMPLGVLIALAMPKRGWGVSVSLVLLALPLLIPWNVIGTIWIIFVRPDIGLLGVVVNGLGVDFDHTAAPLDAWVTVVLMEVWHWTPLVVLLAYAGLRAIPDAFYQAARIDGASAWATFRYIQLPKMRGVLTIAILLRFMDSFLIYAEPFVLTGGGPGNATTFLSIHLVKIAVGQFDLGPAAAFSIIYFLIVLLFSWLFYQALQNVGTGDKQ
jgi:glycerol transport system permease protein